MICTYVENPNFIVPTTRSPDKGFFFLSFRISSSHSNENIIGSVLMKETTKIFLDKYEALTAEGLAEQDIAKAFGINTVQLRKKHSLAKRVEWLEKNNMKERLENAGFNETEVAILCASFGQ